MKGIWSVLNNKDKVKHELRIIMRSSHVALSALQALSAWTSSWTSNLVAGDCRRQEDHVMSLQFWAHVTEYAQYISTNMNTVLVVSSWLVFKTIAPVPVIQISGILVNGSHELTKSIKITTTKPYKIYQMQNVEDVIYVNILTYCKVSQQNQYTTHVLILMQFRVITIDMANNVLWNEYNDNTDCAMTNSCFQCVLSCAA